MALNRELRGYFRINKQVVNPDGSITPGDRFLTKDVPTEDTFKRLFDSCAFILEKDDRATETSQGLVKFTNGNNAKSNTTPSDGYGYAAKIDNLPTLKETTQTIKSLTASLVTASADPIATERNDYALGLSQDFLTFLTDEINTLQSNIDAVDAGSASTGDITAIQGDITAIQGDIINLQNTQGSQGVTLGAVQIDVAGLDSRVTQNEADIAQNASDIAAINPADNRFLSEIVALAANSAPSSKWLACDGSAVSRTTYAALFAIIGTNYGAGDTVTTFNLPDFRGKGMRGYDAVNPLFGFGASGGNDQVTITDANLPEHTHPISTGTADLATYDTAGTDSGTATAGNGATSQVDGTTSLSGSTDVNSTGNQPLEIANPYLTTFFFIKAEA
jgi:microcystin-dependent protein